MSYLESYSRLLSGVIQVTADKQEGAPAEVKDRVDAIFDTLCVQGFDNSQLLALLAIAVDRLTVQEVGQR